MAPVALTGHLGSKIIPKTGCMSVIYIKSSAYSTDGRPNLAAMKRGTGGRSSFNGIVATVFGATGFVGRYVCNKLGKTGSQLILPYRCDFSDAARLKLVGDLGQVLFTPFDLRDEESIARAVQHSNVVINLVGRDYETRNFKYNDVHVEGPRRLARIARENGVERFIHVSYLNQSPNPEPLYLKKPSQYKISKYYGECAVREEFPTATVFRASDIFGVEDRFTSMYGGIWRLWSNWLPMYKNGLATIKQPVYVSDVAQGIVNALHNPQTKCMTYQAVGPAKYQLAEMVDWFHKVMRKDEKWGYKRYDIKYDPLFALKLKFIELTSASRPHGNLHAEAMEKEATTDVVDPSLPTLEDLGVNLTSLESIGPWLLRPYRAYQYYIDQLGEFPTPDPPKRYVD